MSDVELRELAGGDLRFVRRMLLEAAFWRGRVRWRHPAFRMLRHPQLVIYHRGWGRPGDAGVVAVERGRRIGACWYRLFTEEEHGDGYVDPETPELAIGVVADRRGAGVGRALMIATHDLARRDGIRRMALSVDAANPAKRLYESLGYVDLEPGRPGHRMLLVL